MINKNIIIDSNHLQKAIDLKNIKTSFENWSSELTNIGFISLEASLELLKKHEITFPRIISESFSYPMKFYRTRVISPDSPEDISKIKTFSYPPKASYYQRANAPGFPVFYGAVDGKTALEEFRINGRPIKKGDEVYLCEWKIKDNVNYTFTYLTLPQIVGEKYLYSDITEKVYSEIKRIFKSEDPFFLKTQLYLFDQVCQLFLSGNYVQSGTIAYQLLYETPEVNGIKIDGILYPSCSNNFRSVNCAFHPDFVDKNMELVEVRKLSFDAFDEENAASSCRYYGIFDDHKIKWKNYVTELATDNYQIEIDLTSDWPDEDIRSAEFFFEKNKIDFIAFCDERINNLDMNKHKIAQQHETIYRNNGNLTYNLSFFFEENVCYFTKENKINNIRKILLKVPVKALTENVPCDIVLSELHQELKIHST